MTNGILADEKRLSPVTERTTSSFITRLTQHGSAEPQGRLPPHQEIHRFSDNFELY